MTSTGPEPGETRDPIAIPASTVRRLLLAAVGALLLAFTVTSTLKLAFGRDTLFGLVHAFDVYFTATIPTWFEITCLAGGAALAALLALSADSGARRSRAFWWSLAGLGLVASEERLAGTIGRMLEMAFGYADGIRGLRLAPDSVLPLAAGVAAVLLYPLYRRYLRELPRITGRLLIAAAGLYLIGAVPLRSLLWWRLERGDPWLTPGAYALVGAGEGCILLATALVPFALLLHMERTGPSLELRLG